MKTLDEVIAEMEGCGFIGTGADALHYLKEYQKTQMAYIKAMADLEDNPALTWDELKQMFHKPVWIETKAKSTWCIINNFDDECVNVIHTSHKGAKCSHFAKHLMGDTWQAYRKERS